MVVRVMVWSVLMAHYSQISGILKSFVLTSSGVVLGEIRSIGSLNKEVSVTINDVTISCHRRFRKISHFEYNWLLRA